MFVRGGEVCNVGVAPFIRTGCIRYAPGTAHRPFPTVSLIGGFLNRRISKTDTSVLKKTVNCQLFPVLQKTHEFIFLILFFIAHGIHL